MQINLVSKDIELSPEIKDYVIKRVTNLEKLLSGMEEGGGEAIVMFDVGRNTTHHRSGEVFHADCLVKVMGEEFYGSADEEDIRSAIDSVKENLFREINKYKNRKQTLILRGARSVKKMLKGLSKRNPFTGKY